MGKLDGKIALITGATEGMALETAKRFVEEGAFVFITGRRQDKLDEAVALLGRNVQGVQCDSASLADLDRLYSVIREQTKRIDILFSSAGVGGFAPTESVTEQSFDTIFNLNTRGTYFTVQKALPLFNDNASVILNSSVVSVMSMPNMSVYSGSKAALNAFARTWVQELKHRKIRFNLVSPGAIDTAPFQAQPQQYQQMAADRSPRGKVGQPADIAAAVLFLASGDSANINGIDLAVDGGFSIATF